MEYTVSGQEVSQKGACLYKRTACEKFKLLGLSSRLVFLFYCVIGPFPAGLSNNPCFPPIPLNSYSVDHIYLIEEMK